MKTVLFGLLASLQLFAAGYPVDDEIQALREKANYLEAMKNAFEKNACSIELGNTKVNLSAAALRSQGLVIAVGDLFPNNFLAFHQAPKPEHLEGVINVTFKAAKGKGASIISARLGINEQTGKVEKLVVVVNEPVREPSSPELWLYEKAGVALPLSLEEKLSKEVKGTTKASKRSFIVRCN